MRMFLSAIWFIVLTALPSAVTGQQSPLPAQGYLSLEMAVGDEDPSNYYIPPTGINPMIFYEFKCLQNWRRPPNQPSDIYAIQMLCRRQGGAVRIDLELIFGRINEADPKSMASARIESLGTYVIRLGESLSLQELARFGIEPINVKVVFTKLQTLNPAEVVNKTKAIEVVRVYRLWETYGVVLKNISSKNIVGLQLNFPSGSGQTNSLIAPGQVYEMSFSDPISRPIAILADKRPQQSNAQAAPVLQKIVVSSVLLEDSTFEGDKEPALRFMARRRGKKIQVTRILSLLQAAIENPDQDSGRVLENLRQQLSALSDVPDIQVLNDLAGRFGPFTPYQRNGLLGELKNGLSDTKQEMLDKTKLYETREAPKGTSQQSWLRAVKSQFEEVVKKL